MYTLTHSPTHPYTLTATLPSVTKIQTYTSAELLNVQWWRMYSVHGNSSVKLYPTLCVRCLYKPIAAHATMKHLKGGQGNLTTLLTLQDACGICSFCLYNCEPSGFSTISYVAVVTQVTPHDVLYKLCKATSSTQQRDSCSTSLLLSNAPYTAWRYTAKKLTTRRSQISAWNTAIVAFTQHTSAVHAPRCNNFQGNVMRLSRVCRLFVSVMRKLPCG